MGWNRCLSVSDTPRQASLAVNLLKVQPMAIGLIPPSFLVKAQSLAPYRNGVNSGFTNPASMWLQSMVMFRRSLCPASPAVGPVRSFMCWGLRPSIPAADPPGKDWIAARVSSTENCSGGAVGVGGGGSEGVRLGVGCFWRRASTVSGVRGARVSSENRMRAALRMSPSVALFSTALIVAAVMCLFLICVECAMSGMDGMDGFDTFSFN